MLTYIHIKNFIIVQSLSLEFHKGLHVLTGETGAGKSIWIDAIEIGLGGRADQHMIYPGEDTCDITLCFDLTHLPNATTWLQDNNIPLEENCIIRRTIDRNKPSRTLINGMPVPQQLARDFAEHILSIHGQHQHQRLLKMEAQRACLDTYANNASLLEKTANAYEKWHALQKEYEKLSAQATNKNADLTLWKYQLSELENLRLTENEYEQLFSDYQKLHRHKKFATQLETALNCLEHDDHSPTNAIEHCKQQLSRIDNADLEIQNVQELLQTALIHTEEARDALLHYCNKLDFSEEKLSTIENRLNQLQDVARKHHVEPNALLNVIKILQDNIEKLEKADEHLAFLEKAQNDIIADYLKIAVKLSDHRKKAAKKFSDTITTELQELGMEGSVFEASLLPRESHIHPFGQENIQFLITTNKGQAPHPLSQIISGGELSRLSLAIQVLTTSKTSAATLIFDEVDVGIGGKTADLVGKLLRELSKHTQVLCVTHLPQVAALGHHHYKAEKITTHSQTFTSMKTLDATERTAEIARMLSGSKVTEKSLSYAKELLNL